MQSYLRIFLKTDGGFQVLEYGKNIKKYYISIKNITTITTCHHHFDSKYLALCQHFPNIFDFLFATIFDFYF